MSLGNTILVTGACGYIGSATVELLVSEGYGVYGLDLSGIDFPSHIQLPDGSFELISCDLLDDNLENSIPNDIDYVLHLAGLTSVTESFEKPLLYERVNVEGTIRLLTTCEKKEIRRFVFVSTAAVYGQFVSGFDEQHHPTQPINPYGISKLSAEMYVRLLAPRLGCEAVVLRLVNVYGPYQPLTNTGILQAFLSSVMKGEDIVVFGNGTRRRSFLHVRDAARSLVLGVQSSEATGLTIDICDCTSYDVLGVANMVINSFGNPDLKAVLKRSEIDLAEGTPCSGELARRVLDFQSTVSLASGIDEMIRCLQQE